MLALARDMADPAHPAEVCLVLSNRPDAGGLAKAAALGLPTACVDHRPFGGDRACFEVAIQELLAASGAEIVCLAGFMRVLTPGFIAWWQGRMLNVHPSILPLFTGLDTHARCLAAGMAVHGCTVHEVTPELELGADPRPGGDAGRGRGHARDAGGPAAAARAPALSRGAAPVRARRPDQAGAVRIREFH